MTEEKLKSTVANFTQGFIDAVQKNRELLMERSASKEITKEEAVKMDFLYHYNSILYLINQIVEQQRVDSKSENDSSV